MTVQLAPCPITPADLRARCAAPLHQNEIQEQEPTMHYLVRSFRGWVLRSDDGGTLSEEIDLFTLVSRLPRPADDTGRHYLITRETRALAHEHLIREATGWTVAWPFNVRLYDQLQDHALAARKIFAASDASLLGSAKGAVAYAVFDRWTLTLGGYSTTVQRSPQCAHSGIDRLETVAALEAAHAAQRLVRRARLVLSTDSRRAQSMLLELPEMSASQVEDHLQEAALPAAMSSCHPIRLKKSAQRVRQQLLDRHLRLTWVRSHTLNEAAERVRTLEEVRALPERIILRELNVLADQTARVLNSSRSQKNAQAAACRQQLAGLAAARFPGAAVSYRF